MLLFNVRCLVTILAPIHRSFIKRANQVLLFANIHFSVCLTYDTLLSWINLLTTTKVKGEDCIYTTNPYPASAMLF